MIAEPPRVRATETGGDKDIPDIVERGETISEEASVLSNRAFREVKKNSTHRRAGEERVDGLQISLSNENEPRSFWQSFAVFLVLGIVVLLLLMLGLLRR